MKQKLWEGLGGSEQYGNCLQDLQVIIVKILYTNTIYNTKKTRCLLVIILYVTALCDFKFYAYN